MIALLREAVADTCGGKAASLGALLRSGLPVPDGFVIPFDVHRDVVRDRGLAVPAGLLDALRHGLEALGDAPVAVRSSATGEDTAHASGAGQHESVLAVRGADEVAAAVRTCWASLHSSRATAYQAGSGENRPAGDPAMAVLVQRLIDAEVSGVMFTAAEPEDTVMIEASWGLGPSVVGGAVTPDSYRVAADGSITRDIADKQTRLDREGTRLVTSAVPAGDRARPSLDDRTATRIAGLGREIADLLGGAQDIEWAITGGRIWLLQARPITVAPLPATACTQAAEPGTLTGTPGSPGTATGPARIVRAPRDFARVRAGDILACPYTDPAWTPLLRMVAGVVTEVGGALSHAAIVARERQIPAVLGVPDAMSTIHDGATISIDGATGTVTPA